MKSLLVIITIFLLCSDISAQDQVISDKPSKEQQTCTITIQIEGLKSNKGKLFLSLYDSQENWLSKGCKEAIVNIENRTATVQLEGVPYGTYAISTFHDENDNKKLDTGFLGIPVEPYASSRGAKGRFGPPKWKHAKFVIESNAQSEIIKY